MLWRKKIIEMIYLNQKMLIRIGKKIVHVARRKNKMERKKSKDFSGNYKPPVYPNSIYPVKYIRHSNYFLLFFGKKNSTIILFA